MSRTVAVFEHQIARHRAMLASTVIQSLVSPFAFLGALGLGLGSLIDDRNDPSVLGAPSYVAFVAPALVVASAMQSGVALAAWPVLGAVKWERSFHAIVSTPVRVWELVGGFLGWMGLRMLLAGSVFVLVTVLFGIASSWGVVAVPVFAAATGLAFAAPMAAFSAHSESDAMFSVILRLVVLPLFMLGGVFFPLTQLPDLLEAGIRVTPLWQGVKASRDLSLGAASLSGTLARLAYLCSYIAFGAVALERSLTHRLMP
jgi:lipooligosaccharide transport system permease protein